MLKEMVGETKRVGVVGSEGGGGGGGEDGGDGGGGGDGGDGEDGEIQGDERKAAAKRRKEKGALWASCPLPFYPVVLIKEEKSKEEVGETDKIRGEEVLEKETGGKVESKEGEKKKEKKKESKEKKKNSTNRPSFAAAARRPVKGVNELEHGTACFMRHRNRVRSGGDEGHLAISREVIERAIRTCDGACVSFSNLHIY